MKKILQSKWTAWLAFIVTIILLVVTFKLRTPWWTFTDIFFLFMASFTNLMAVYLKKVNSIVSGKLYTAAFLFAILWAIAFIAEWVAFQYFA